MDTRHMQPLEVSVEMNHPGTRGEIQEHNTHPTNRNSNALSLISHPEGPEEEAKKRTNFAIGVPHG